MRDPILEKFLIHKCGMQPDLPLADRKKFLGEQYKSGALTKEQVSEVCIDALVNQAATCGEEAKSLNDSLPSYEKEFGAEKAALAREQLAEASAAQLSRFLDEARKHCSHLGWSDEQTDAYLAKLRDAYEHPDTTPEIKSPFGTSLEENEMSSASPTPAQVFGGAGQPNVKKASERYSTTTYEAKHFRFGHAVERNGETVKTTSERDKAKAGVFIKELIRSRVPGANLPPRTEHEKELALPFSGARLG